MTWAQSGRFRVLPKTRNAPHKIPDLLKLAGRSLRSPGATLASQHASGVALVRVRRRPPARGDVVALRLPRPRGWFLFCFNFHLRLNAGPARNNVRDGTETAEATKRRRRGKGRGRGGGRRGDSSLACWNRSWGRREHRRQSSDRPRAENTRQVLQQRPVAVEAASGTALSPQCRSGLYSPPAASWARTAPFTKDFKLLCRPARRCGRNISREPLWRPNSARPSPTFRTNVLPSNAPHSLPQWEAANSARYGSSKTFSANSPGTASGRSGGSGGPRDGAGRDVGNGVGSYMGNGTESDDDAIDAKSPNGTTLAKMDRKTFSIMLQVFSLHWCVACKFVPCRLNGRLRGQQAANGARSEARAALQAHGRRF